MTHFIYKNWWVFITEGFASYTIHFSLYTLYFNIVIKRTIKEKGLENNSFVQREKERLFEEISEAEKSIEIPSIKVSSWGWGAAEKCKNIAISHIDDKLGDGIEYMFENYNFSKNIFI